MEMIVIKETLEADLQTLIRCNQLTFERTGNTYYRGKADAYRVALEMVQEKL